MRKKGFILSHFSPQGTQGIKKKKLCALCGENIIYFIAEMN